MNTSSPVQVCAPTSALHNPLIHMRDKEVNNHLHQHILSAQSQGPSTLAVKQAEAVKPTLQNTTHENPNIFTRFQHKITQQYGRVIVTEQVKYAQEVKQNSCDVLLRYQLAYRCLLLMEILAYEIKTSTNPDRISACKAKFDSLSGRVNFESQSAKTIDSLHSLSYYIDCLILEYKGVDCRDMVQVEEYVRLLRICLALDPNSVEIKKNLEETIKFLEGRWQALKKEGVIDSATHTTWQQTLGSILKSDPLKHLFRNNPELFNLARLTTHTEFFKQHPELKSKQAFATKYPECAQELGVELPKPAQQPAQQVIISKPANLSEKENTQPVDSHVQLKDLDKDKYSLQTMKEITQQGKSLKECILIEAVELIKPDGTRLLVFAERQKAEEFVKKFGSMTDRSVVNIKGLIYKVSIVPEDRKEKLKEIIHESAFHFTIENNMPLTFT